jgi:uncharacterized protein YggE
MQRTITVKGTGTAKAAPDLIRLVFSLESKDFDYGFAMRFAERKLESMKDALATVGFDRKDLKTLSFDVRTDHSSEKDSNGNYKRVFNGYICSHRLKLEFDFDTKQLASTLNAIATCVVDPELSIAFTVKDPSAISAELLRNATANAREKAEILCAASNVKLGDLLNINYNWGELDIVSHTDFDMPMKCAALSPGGNIDIEPDDISLSDTATFVWEIS